MLVQCDLHPFGFDFAVRVLSQLLFVLLGLYFEAEAKQVVFILEEVLQNYILVFLQNAVFALDERRKQPQVLGSQLSRTFATGLNIKTIDQVSNLLLGDGRLDGLGVVLQDAHQALLDVLSVDVFGVFQEEVHPPRQVELILTVTHHDFLQKTVNPLKDI